MPVRVEKIKGLNRIVEEDGSIAKTKTGKPRDGGGHTSKTKAMRQVGYINK